jgi:nucleoside-diphosphate-sugar epimerase
MLDVFEREHPGIRVVRVRPAFVFQRSSAAQQRRLFGGPLVPGSLLRPSLVPLVPFPAGLRMQAVHSDDVGDALRRVLEADDATGAFNLAADDSLDGDDVAGLFEARRLPVPPRAARAALSAAWHARAVPAPPDLYDALLRLPTMSTERATSVLGWSPAFSAADALTDMLAGLRTGQGGDTPPLRPDAGGTARWREVASGAGSHDRVE